MSSALTEAMAPVTTLFLYTVAYDYHFFEDFHIRSHRQVNDGLVPTVISPFSSLCKKISAPHPLLVLSIRTSRQSP